MLYLVGNISSYFQNVYYFLISGSFLNVFILASFALVTFVYFAYPLESLFYSPQENILKITPSTQVSVVENLHVLFTSSVRKLWINSTCSLTNEWFPILQMAGPGMGYQGMMQVSDWANFAEVQLLHMYWFVFLAHLSQRLKWAIVIAHRPSVVGPSVVCKLSHFQLLLQNRLMDFDETW